MSDRGERPVLVLGLGNLLLHDDAVGLRLLAELQARHGDDPRVEFVDGGTQGLALVSLLAARPAVLLLDAVQHDGPAGTVHRVDDPFARPPRGNAGARGGAHQMNAGDLLLAVRLLGELPGRACVVGIEPAVVRTAIALSPAVEAAIPAGTTVASEALGELLAAVEVPCTN
jgi:hydrogenase maturation protease